MQKQTLDVLENEIQRMRDVILKLVGNTCTELAAVDAVSESKDTTAAETFSWGGEDQEASPEEHLLNLIHVVFGFTDIKTETVRQNEGRTSMSEFQR